MGTRDGVSTTWDGPAAMLDSLLHSTPAAGNASGIIRNPTRIGLVVLGWWMTTLLAVPMVTRVTYLVVLVTTMLGALGFFILTRFEGINVKMKKVK